MLATPAIIRNTILDIFKTEQRLLSKKELVRITKFTNRHVKDILSDLISEGFLQRETSGYQLIKAVRSDEDIDTSVWTRGNIQRDVLKIFNSLKDEDLDINNLIGFLDGKYDIKQVRNCLSRLTKTDSLLQIKPGLYMLTGKTENFIPVVRPHNSRIPDSKKPAKVYALGLYAQIRNIFPKLTPPFNSAHVIDLMPATYTHRQIYNGINYLVGTQEVVRLSTGVYKIANQKEVINEVNVGEALEEKKELVIQEKEISCVKALEAHKTFIKLQLGHKTLGGDYSIVIKIGAAILKGYDWKEKQIVTMNWISELKRMRIFPADVGFEFFMNDKGVYEVVIPLPEGTGHLFPKPMANHSEINITEAHYSLGKDKDLIISLEGVRGIEYV